MTPNLDVMAPLWKDDPLYREYAFRQAEKTQKYRTFVSGHRVTDLVGLWVRAMAPQSPIGLSVLAVGCRNAHELDVLHAAGFEPIGIDLCSADRRIHAMDMHQLTFPDHSFDAVFASHSLEHSYDPDVVLREWARVVRMRGWWVIEVPIGYTQTAVDRHDFGSAVHLVARCQAAAASLVEVVLAEELADRAVARLVLRCG